MDTEKDNMQEGMAEGQNPMSRDGNQQSEGSDNHNTHYSSDKERRPYQQRRPYQGRGGYRPDGYEGGQAQEGKPYHNRYGGGYGNRYGGGYGKGGAGYGSSREGGAGYGSSREGGAGYGSSRERGAGYGDNREGGAGYGSNREGGAGYGGSRGGYRKGGNRGGYQNGSRGGYRQGGNRGGYQHDGKRQGFRKHNANYDPNAKYSQKKQIEYKEENYDPNEPIRLNRYLANAGVCSRREADDFIQAGVVSVNGNVVTELGTKVLRSDEVKFNNQKVSIEKKVYILLNKPKDCVTTSDDPQQRKTVLDLVKGACKERIYPVGRLDRNTTGVLLLTNDGDLASKLTHPKYLKKKIYHVYLDKNVTAHDMQQMRDGVILEDGEVKVDAVEYADPVDKKQVGVEIHSGKNRIVRRIFESLGYRVTKLDRVQFAGLTKKNVRRGDWRFLTEEEVERLRMGAYE